MAKRPSLPPNEARARLLKSRDEARSQLLSRKEQGDEIAARPFTGPSDLARAEQDSQRWADYNFEMIRRMFSTEEYANAYRRAGFGTVTMDAIMYGSTFGKEVRAFLERLGAQLNYLVSLAEQLDLIDEDRPIEPVTAPIARRSGASGNLRVFLVHGQDEEAKAIVARFIERCGLQPVILHEQADRGRTIIEKFEAEADVGFAVVLLTPDDVGGLRTDGASDPGELRPRARQNVVLELGYFIGRLGRSHVCALRKGELELPSDISGVIYTPLGADDAWKIRLAKELKAAGYPVDMNRVFG